MRTVDRLLMRAPLDRVFAASSDVLAWPRILPHYRYVRAEGRNGDAEIVAMSANRPFGPFNWPTWWTSKMWIDTAAHTVRYTHVRGITTGMDVLWSMHETPAGIEVTIVHDWDGPPWPLIGSLAASLVIGPVFVHGIASRTLAGIAKHLEQRA